MMEVMNSGQVVDGKYSRARCKELIDLCDEDGDMQLDWREFLHMMMDTTQKKKSDEEVKREEYLKKVGEAQRIANMAKRRNMDAFDFARELDADGDGNLTRAELDAILRRPEMQ